jgi:uncharacterized membrane protein YoaK (UPF0700 family)
MTAGRARMDKRNGRNHGWLAILLAWVAGFVDALGYVTLLHVFTSHMSGNSVAMVATLSQHNWSEAVHRAFPILFFVIGLFLAALLERIGCRAGIHRRFSLALGIEAALLIGFVVYGSNPNAPHLSAAAPFKFHALIVLLAMAMGIQSATLRRVHGQSVHTTFITGMLLQFAEGAAGLTMAWCDRMRRRMPLRTGNAKRHLDRMLFYGGIWTSFVIGAVCGGYAEHAWKALALLAPLSILGLIILYDLIRPVHEPEC